MNAREMDGPIPFLIESARPSVLKDNLEHLANKALLAYRREEHLRPGANGAESLYARALNGVFILGSLCDLLELPAVEARVLLTAYTVHVLHISADRKDSAGTADEVAVAIERPGLTAFFPDWNHGRCGRRESDSAVTYFRVRLFRYRTARLSAGTVLGWRARLLTVE